MSYIPLKVKSIEVAGLIKRMDINVLVRQADQYFRVRRNVLNMTIQQWKKLDSDYLGSPRNFLETIGLPGGLSAKFNAEERRFFDVIYAIERAG